MILACLYLQLGIAAMQPHPVIPNHYWEWDINQVVNPYGTIEAGCDIPLPKHLHLEFAVHHISSIPVNDFGANTAEIRLRWYPWGR